MTDCPFIRWGKEEADYLIANQFSWIDQEPASFPYRCRAKIRYRQQDMACWAHPMEDGSMRIDFDLPQRAATPGQSVVFYQGEECLGGGIIQSVGPSYFEQKKELDLSFLSSSNA